MFKETTKPLEITPDTTPIEVPANIELKPWRSILLKAADLIETKGWCRDAYKKSNRHCAVGALREASGITADPDYDENGHESRQLKAAYRALENHLRLGWGGTIEEWNDGIAKSGKQVVTVMREAALKGVRRAK